MSEMVRLPRPGLALASVAAVLAVPAGAAAGAGPVVARLAENPSPWVPSASRAGNTLTLDLTPFSDNTPGHLGATGVAVTTGHYSISENGKQIAAGEPRTHFGFNGEFDNHMTLSHSPGTITFALSVAAADTGASVSVSFDGGKVWHPAQVSGHAGNYTAVFTAPAGATVTLRAHAADAAGGTVTETITSAYRVAS